MKNYFLNSRILFWLTILSFIFIFGCRSKKSDETDVNQTEPNAIADVSVDEVAVTVNGVDITESEINALIDPQLEIIAKRSPQWTPKFAQQYREQLRKQALEKLIVEHLLDEKVKENNILVTEDDVIELITKELSAQSKPISLEEYKEMLAKNGRSFDEMVQENQKGLAYEEVMEIEGADKVSATEGDAKKFYDENPKQFERPEEVRASHILIQPDPNEANQDEAKAKAKEEAQELLKQIREGADFAELAKANSQCPSAPNGGDLEYFPRGMMTAPFEQAAFELEVGQISDVVETEFGYHIIKVTDHREGATVSFEEVKEKITEYLTKQKRDEFNQKYIEKLKAEADIVYSSDNEEPRILTITPPATP